MTTKLKIGLSLAGVAVIAVAASVYLSNRMRPAVTEAQPLPAVTLTTLTDPKPYDLAQHKGKVVVLDFWGST